MDTVEPQIFQHIKQGNQQSFEKLFKSHYPLLCHYAERFVKNSDLAEEIVQDLFFQIWTNRDQLNIEISVNAYLYKATYNNCMDWLRKQQVRKTKMDHVAPSNDYTFNEEHTEQEEIHQIIRNTLLQMPERVRTIFQLSRFKGLKYHEIAAQLSISIKTVESNMSKALRLFRNNLKDYVGLL